MKGPIEKSFLSFVSHYYKIVNAVVDLRELDKESMLKILTMQLQRLEPRITSCLSSLPEGVDKRVLISFLQQQYGAGNLAPTADYLSTLLPVGSVTPWNVYELLMRAQVAELTHLMWLRKSTYMSSDVSRLVTKKDILWRSTKVLTTPWRCEGSGYVLEAKLCAYPFEPLYAILLNGCHAFYCNDWPGNWNRDSEISEAGETSGPRPTIFEQIAKEFVDGQWLSTHRLGVLQFDSEGQK